LSLTESFENLVLSAWQRRLDFAELIAVASQLDSAGKRSLSAVLYMVWLSRNTSPLAHVVNFNLGATLSLENDIDGAETAYREAIRLSPGFVQPRVNLGTLLEGRGKIEEALAEWRWVEQNVSAQDPNNRPLVVMALNQMGRVLEIHKRLDEATNALTKSLSIEPLQKDVIHHWVSLRQKQCLWPTYVPLPKLSRKFMYEATSALSMLSVSDDNVAQLEAARRYVKNKLNSDVPNLSNPNGYGHRKVRIGYASGDFCLHPVSLLTVELFELHDREKFEVYGYCWSPEDGSPMRQRVISAMDHFTKIHTMSDVEAAQLIRRDEIDILVDLQGQTAGARANMLAYRPAPVQITYLGLPATTGLPSIDYVIADKFLIPEKEASNYSERPIYMPDVYQASDRKRNVGPKPSRADCNLPPEGFVFCTFNNNYKYTPDVFDAWMNILRRVPDSVLLLLADNQWSEANLKKEAKARKIDPKRLVFGPRLSPENYLARYQVADLFLDSFPFNAGTTANDALWMGLPLLTLTGRSFASRMAGALLTAAKMESLITYNLKDYEEKAVALANDPTEMARLRAHLQTVRSEGVLFDTSRFVRKLEERLLPLAKLAV
jgi:predicted O-linked N-acetylglucosamine transferase (SPINDLY family)